MFCCKCGNEMPDEGVFCPECGAKQEPQQAAWEGVCEDVPVFAEAPACGDFPAFEEAPACEDVPSYAEFSNYEEGSAFAAPCDPDTKRCGNCGAAIPLDSRFCPECRARQSHSAAAVSKGKNWGALLLTKVKSVLQKLITPELKAAFRKYKKQISLAVTGAAALCLVLLLVCALGKPRINLNKYLTVYPEGFDGYGYMQIIFDRDGFCRDYGKDLAKVVMADRLEQQSGSLIGGSGDKTYIYEDACSMFLEECVDAHLFNDDLLSNGDEFTFHWICKDATALNKYGVKLRYRDIKHTVRSLQEAEYFDPFEGVEVTFEGVSPYGRAHLEGDPVAPQARDMSYRLDVSDNLSNGDTVTITVSGYWDDPVNYYLDHYGMLPTSLTKEVTVSGLGSYVTESAQLTEEALKDLLRQTEDIYKAKMAQYPQTGENLVEFNYMGNYLMVNKDREMFGGEYNRLYLVYKVRMRNQYSSDGKIFDKTTDLYWFIRFNNVMVDENGVLSADLTYYQLPEEEVRIDSDINNVRWNYRGYQTLDAMYADVVAVSVEIYICESTVKAG